MDISVIVPLYNEEESLPELYTWINHVMTANGFSYEIIFVNDGSTDGTLAIANEYKERYPQSVVVIDKPNGHYGSCVNASLKVATGKYFRIVDADDWVDSEALVLFIKTLENINVDCVCTKYTTHNFQDNKVTTRELDMHPNVVMDLNVCSIPKEILHMHNMTYSLNLLKRIGYTQTEGICYTDTEYVYLPLSCSKDMMFIDISLYQYYIGRGDQSMSDSVLQKNYTHLIKVNKQLLDEHKSELPFNVNEDFIWSMLVNRLVSFETPSYLLSRASDKATDTTLRESIHELKQLNICKSLLVFDNRFHGIPYVAIWYHSPWLYKILSVFFRVIYL